MKKKGIIVLSVVMISILLAVCGIVFRPKVIHNKHYSKNFGSVSIKIYDDGRVYMDDEMEEPNHKWKLKYVMTLSKEEMEEVRKIIAEDEAIDKQNGKEKGKGLVKYFEKKLGRKLGGH